METQTATTKKQTKKAVKKTVKPKAPAQQMAPEATPAKQTASKKGKKTVQKVEEPVVEVQPEETVQTSEQALEEANTELSFEHHYDLMVNRMKALREEVRSLETALKHLGKCASHEKKLAGKKKKKTSSSPNTGAKMQMTLTNPAVCKFLGIEVGGQASRADLMRAIYGYVQEKGLKNQENKREFKLDATLQTLFPDRNVLQHNQVMGAISPFFPKKGAQA